jgi:two-component sensor histidine kinase/CheY-like chemotaxis protein
VPEDREAALAAVQQVRAGAAMTHQFRIQRPSDQAFRWIRNTGFPMRDGKGEVTRIGGIFEDVTDAKLAVEHQGVLLAELQHRVRNIMAIVRSITARTGERAQSVAEYAELMAGRLHALTRVQTLLTRAPNAQVRIESIVRDEVSVQAEHEDQYDLGGPDIVLSPKAAEILTLAVHELATNALKYGALSVPSGKVTVRWDTVEKLGVVWLTFDWSEQGAPGRPQVRNGAASRRGFGSELIEARIPYELRGHGELVFENGGARCHLEFPLRPGASVLETGAPQRATVSGGVLDMSGIPDLSGFRVLVIEDEYYIATDIARTLRGAGATVSGPCPSEEAARDELVAQRPDAVVLDINLGSGPSFTLAETVKDHGIPFVFVTGYDQGKIPEEFREIERLEKPTQLRHIVQAIGKLVGVAA